MKTRTALARAIRLAIGGAAGLSASLATPIAVAQESPGALDEVVITGSRIRQNPLEQRLPVLSIGQEDYQASGATSIADFVQKLPIAGSAINRANNSSGNLGYPPDGGGIGAGAAEMDLRYLASKRVLVLVDGRRWVKGSSGSGVSGAVDLNSIPANAVKAIEILQDGASAIYGSDAIGGVLNIITSDDYDGFRISGYSGQYGDGDGETSEFDIRMGSRGERGRGLLDISYTDQKEVNTADRSTSQFPIPGFPFGVSSGAVMGRFIFCQPPFTTCDPDDDNGFFSVAPNSAGTLTWDPSDPNNLDPDAADGDDFHRFALADRFNYQPFNHLITPNERISVFAKGEYDVTDEVMFRVLASFNNRQSQGRAAPVPLFFGPDGGSTPYMVNVVWPANHPFNPFGIDIDSSNLSFFARRPTEAGPRIFNQDVDTWYVSGGFDGEFSIGERNMYWDVTGIWSENNARQTKLNQFNARSINVAMGDPAVCAATPGCTPLNIVGEGSITQAMLDFITYTGVDTSSQELTDFTANLSGELFDLPAGPFGFAVGYEHREEDGSFIPDPVVAAGETADVPTNPTAGGYDVDEFYGEVVVPILKDAPGADSLSFSAAARVSDSNLFSSETGSKLALNWGPVESVMLRASYSEGFRAPNIGELFNLGARFDSSITDRCSNVQPADAANCAALGVPAGYTQINPQISVDTGGNPDLEPETSETLTFGFTWDVPIGGTGAIDRFLIEANYYDIDIEDAVQAPDGQDLLDACIDTQDPLICSQINRQPSGTITSIVGVLNNIGGIETKGVDINLDLSLAETGVGAFRFQLLSSLLLDYDELFENPAGGFDRVERAGVELGSPTRGFVEEKVTLNTHWSRGAWGGLLALRYLSSLTEQCVGLVADFELTADFCNGPLITPPLPAAPFRAINKLDNVVYTDLQFSWAPDDLFGGGWSFAVGVNNLLDEKPPICFSCDLNSLDGTIYPIAGQFWYIRAAFEN
ncbi:MAG: TonB-dependent receptor plug domain-containing protein [Steroidobacteraceae bacterium]